MAHALTNAFSSMRTYLRYLTYVWQWRWARDVPTQHAYKVTALTQAYLLRTVTMNIHLAYHTNIWSAYYQHLFFREVPIAHITLHDVFTHISYNNTEYKQTLWYLLRNTFWFKEASSFQEGLYN